jgi:hypothetical protein
MGGRFIAGQFRFDVEHHDYLSDRERGFTKDFCGNDFGLRLTRSGYLPDLDGAPLASWLLARLARLTDDGLGVFGEEHNDGGGFMVEFVVYLLPKSPDPRQLLLFDLEQSEVPLVPERPVASFQFQGAMDGVGIVGQRVPNCAGEDILDALEAALFAAPNELMACEVTIYDPEWEQDPLIYIPVPHEDSRNVYGWDRDEFLGKWNIRDAPLR